jgi:hypothetical protein
MNLYYVSPMNCRISIISFISGHSPFHCNTEISASNDSSNSVESSDTDTEEDKRHITTEDEDDKENYIVNDGLSKYERNLNRTESDSCKPVNHTAVSDGSSEKKIVWKLTSLSSNVAAESAIYESDEDESDDDESEKYESDEDESDDDESEKYESDEDESDDDESEIYESDEEDTANDCDIAGSSTNNDDNNLAPTTGDGTKKRRSWRKVRFGDFSLSSVVFISI